jgi:uracil-DNA glycosylase
MAEKHPVERLFELLSIFGEYPDGVVPLHGRITGTAFFPGSAGLWGTHAGAGLPPMPVGGVMVLGHNFDSETSFVRSLANGTERTNGPTWGTLHALFTRAGIPMECCFFTNAYMGLKAGAKSTGAFPGARDPNFVRRCQAFLLEQIRTQQPKLILTLGKEVLPMIAPLAPELLASWSGVRSIQELDERTTALVSRVWFPGLAQPCEVLALTHPAHRAPNVTRRHHRGAHGDAAELALLHEALTRVHGSCHGETADAS